MDSLIHEDWADLPGCQGGERWTRRSRSARGAALEIPLRAADYAARGADPSTSPRTLAHTPTHLTRRYGQPRISAYDLIRLRRFPQLLVGVRRLMSRCQDICWPGCTTERIVVGKRQRGRPSNSCLSAAARFCGAASGYGETQLTLISHSRNVSLPSSRG